MKAKPDKSTATKPEKADVHGNPAETIAKKKAELTDEELTKVSGGSGPHVSFHVDM